MSSRTALPGPQPSPPPGTAAGRLVAYWAYGGALAGLVLLALVPLLGRAWPVAVTLTALHLPIYMLHQWEEHDDDRFRRFVNASVGGGREVLTPLASFLINVPGVWGVMLITTWFAAEGQPGYGLVAADLVLCNAALHLGHALVIRRYVPGLATALVLFVPLGLWTTAVIHAAGAAGWPYPVIGWVAAILLHAAVPLCARATGGAWPQRWPAP